MFFPGAIYIIDAFIIVAALFVCLVGGLAGAVIFHGVAPKLVHKTKTYKTMVTGAKGNYPWWTKDHRWFSVGGWTGFTITAYVLAGPVWALISYVGSL